ncbi:response regulator [Aestuariivirga sp.]|uniref:response regulator n=1 Tax=Aestuariivirga sp. TaxID=2650926 RepID=UPI0039192518
MTKAGHILVVDDTPSMQLKLLAAARALGHTAEAAASGPQALEYLHGHAVDAVLLDIVMPDMDGFEVLRRMKSDRRLHDIPVIVISGLDDTDSAVKAIELGAEDFLPKSFDPVIFRARVNTLLQKKFVRDAEVDYLRQVDKLAKAAQILKLGNYNPSKLGLQEISGRSDALGDLARVFSDAAQKVYEREKRLRHTIKTLRGGIGIVILGLVWGLVVPLSRMASDMGADPVGMALWVSLIGGSSCLLLSFAKGWLPPWRRIPWGFFILYAIVGAVFAETFLFFIAGKVEASLISIIVVFEGFLAFGFAAFAGIEKPSLTRFLGLALGLCGVSLVLLDQFKSTSVTDVLWTVAAFAIPLCYALEGIMLAGKRPEHIHVVPMIGIMQLVAAAMLVPIAWASGEWSMPRPGLGGLEATILLIVAASVCANILFYNLIQHLGSVFASQSAYFTTAAGIGWSMLLLGERLTGWVWAAVGLMAVGLFLVGAKREAELEVPAMLDAEAPRPT